MISLKNLAKQKDHLEKKQRMARLMLCLVYFDGMRIIRHTTSINGYIAGKPSKNRIAGFPYRSLLKVIPIDKYYDELTAEEHRQFNHRHKAVLKLVHKLTK